MYFVRQGCRQFLPDVAKMLSVGWKIGLPCLQAKSIRRIQSWNILLCFQISMNINVQQYYMFGKFKIFENLVTWHVKARISPWIGCIAAHCTMCILFHTNSAGLLKLGHILKNPKKYFFEYIFFPALTTRRKMEKSKFLWFSNSKFAIFCDFRVIFPDFECSKNTVSSAGK